VSISGIMETDMKESGKIAKSMEKVKKEVYVFMINKI